MHKDRNQNKWAELKTHAKNHWSGFNDKPLNRIDVKRSDFNDDIHDAQKIKDDRASKHLKNVRHILRAMSPDDFNN